MNQLASSLLWLLAGGILGVFADMTLFRVTLPFYHAILDWLATFDNRAVTHYAFRLWTMLPTFFVALLAGIISGRFVRDRLIFKLILFGIGFLLAPIVVEFFAEQPWAFRLFDDWRIFLTVHFQRGIITTIALSSAYLSRKLARATFLEHT